MAHTKQSCMDLGRTAGEIGGGAYNPFKPDSWQANSWSDGYRAARAAREQASARNAAEAGQGPKVSDRPEPYGSLAPYPARMPLPTRQHVALLNERALSTENSTLALRLDRKIDVLYQRYA